MMTGSDLSFVSRCPKPDDAARTLKHIKEQETAIMTLRLVRNLAFALAALAVVAAASYTVEVQPVINALAR